MKELVYSFETTMDAIQRTNQDFFVHMMKTLSSKNQSHDPFRLSSHIISCTVGAITIP